MRAIILLLLAASLSAQEVPTQEPQDPNQGATQQQYTIINGGSLTVVERSGDTFITLPPAPTPTPIQQ